MKKLKKIKIILLIVFFPIAMVYCIGKALFTGQGFASYLGMFFIFGLGTLLGVYLGNPEMVKGWFQAIARVFGG